MKRLDKDVAPADDDFWKETVKNVKKIKQVEEKPSAPLIIDDIKDKLEFNNIYTGNKLNELYVGCVDNIDKNTADKFKRGQIAIQRRLDLHGMTEKQAFDAVQDFITKAYMQKLRCVLIVTGKGINHEDTLWYEKKGILKECVPNWLNGELLRPMILSFSYAQPQDGGEGALYVLIRRNRKIT
ncbi:MAG: hypothetical protein E7012_04875 [Alphaproteobacteria bacterium]|nr:hypothetical protein [Alphaproteobacteria bacterium]